MQADDFAQHVRQAFTVSASMSTQLISP
jgi:hypothetical protein